MLEEIGKSKQIKVLKLSEEAKLPTKADGDMCYDIYSNEDCFLEFGKVSTIKTGIKLVPPDGYHYSVRDRSGLAAKHGLHILAGQIDNSYRGELLVCMTKLKSEFEETPIYESLENENPLCAKLMEHVRYEIQKGDKIAQIKFEKDTTFDVVEVKSEEDLGTTNRGERGFGSSGK